jgi:hypothetical protein
MSIQEMGAKDGTSESGAKASWGFMSTKQGVGNKKGKVGLHEGQVLQLSQSRAFGERLPQAPLGN